MAERSFPLENTVYNAEEAALWFATRTSGVYANDELKVKYSGGMFVAVEAGIAWLAYKRFAGVAYANTEEKALAIPTANQTMPRIDRVVVRYSSALNGVVLAVLSGTPSASPIPPTLRRTENIYEISLAQVYVGAGATEIIAANITDERFNNDVCGLMRDGVTRLTTEELKGDPGEKGDPGASPYIGGNGNWFVYDDSKVKYVDSGISAKAEDGEPGADGVSPTLSVSTITGGRRITIKDASGTKTVDVMDGGKGDKGDAGDTGETGGYYEPVMNGTVLKEWKPSRSDMLTISQNTDLRGPAGLNGTDGGYYTPQMEGTVLTGWKPSNDSMVQIFESVDLQGPAGADGAAGAEGQRGTGILKATTAPTSYTTSTGGKNPIKRMSISTIKSQAGVNEVLVGDQISYSYYLYHVYYLDATYAYMDVSQSIRGAAGAAGKDGSDATVTSANIASALGYTPADAAEVSQLSEAIDEIGTQEDIVQAVIAALGTPVFGTVDENKHITLSGHLVDGTYTITFEDTDGFVSDVCTIEKGAEEVIVYTHTLTDNRNSGTQMVRVGGEDYTMYINLASTNNMFNIVQTTGEQALHSDAALTQITPYYPLKVPAGATKFKVNIHDLSTTSGLVIRQFGMTLANGIYTRVGYTDWTAESVLEQDIGSADYEYVVIEVRRNDYGGWLSTTFSGVSVEWL